MADPFVLVPVADPLIGMVIGSFVIVRVLGRGGMGAVYLAQHKAAAHIRCVFKTILAHLSNHPLMISRFNTEIDAVGRLSSHENIVELKDFGVLPNGQMYMQFEYIDGIPLDRFLADWGGRLSLHRAAYLAFQVCDALDHAHANGVVHRDLKPENLMVVVQDKKRIPRLVKLVDFGVSKVVRTGEVQTMSGMKMGTPYYMSIEQYANAAEASGKSDVYSLAILLWQMITGELPWGRPDPNVLYHIQRTVVPTPPPENVMLADVAKLLLRCLSIEPDDRPTMQELAVELAAVIPATDDAPSGGAILLHIAPHFLSSSPDHASTMPRAALANPDLVAAQLWPPVNVAVPASAPFDGRLPPPRVDVGNDRAAQLGAARDSSPVVSGETRASVSVKAESSAPVSRSAAGAAAAPDAPPGAAVAPLVVESVAVAASLPTAPAVEARGRTSASRPPVMAALPTGLISQKHVAQAPPADLLSAVPRVRSVVAAAEIDLALGTPGPEPYAHSELPAVVVSATQLSIVSAQGTEPSTQPKRVPEQPPVLILPRSASQTSRLGLVAICVAAVGVFIATATVVRSWHRSPVAERKDEGSAHATGTRAGGPVTPVDAAATPEGTRILATAPAGAVTAPAGAVTVTDIDGGMVPSSVNAPAAPRAANSTTDHTDAPTPASPVKPASSADTGRVVSSRASPSQKTLRARQADARSTGAKMGNLHVLVTPWAVCWIDGERIDQTPCMLDDLPVGRYRVRLENSAMHKVETLTATVTAGDTTTIERAW